LDDFLSRSSSRTNEKTVSGSSFALTWLVRSF
jgi:hypothetical protein